MNAKKIVQMIKPYVKNDRLTYDDFEKIFCMLSQREKYRVAEFIEVHLKVLLVDEIKIVGDYEKKFVEYVLNKIESCIEDNQVTYDEFEKIFGDLEKMKQYTVTNILAELKIELVDEKILSEEKNLPLKMPLISKSAKAIKLSNHILLSLIKNGDRQALQDLCVKNRGLVDKYAYLYDEKYPRHLDFEDLEQLGMLGIIESAKRFDFDKETQFSTYATWWIRQIMHRAIIDTGFMIRLPVQVFEKILKARALDSKFYKYEKNKSERLKLIAEEMNLTVEGVKNLFALYDAFINIKSLDEPIGEDNDTVRLDILPEENQESVEEIIMKLELREKIDELLKTLTDREKKVLILRYGLKDNKQRTLEEVGKILNLTRERIRQIENQALEKLRHPSRSKKLKDFVQQKFWEELHAKFIVEKNS